MASKPPYVPLRMQDVLDAEGKRGYTVASTFSGAGGSCMGYRLAGYRLVWANEFEPTAAQTYKDNAQCGCVLDTRDIRVVKGEDILRATGLALGELDLFDGSPPCQSFSTAGKRERGWGKAIAHADGTTQRSDDLFEEYIRLVSEVQPKTFVAENVTGLVKGVAKGYFKRVLALMRSVGYNVEAAVLDARWLGVPQARQRVIFVGVRNDIAAKLGKFKRFPTPNSWFYSVADACPWIIKHGTSPTFDGEWKQSGRDPLTTLVSSTKNPAPTIVAGGLSGGAGAALANSPRMKREAHGYFPGDDKDPRMEPAPTLTSSTLKYSELHDAGIEEHPDTGDPGDSEVVPGAAAKREGQAWNWMGKSSFIPEPVPISDKASQTIMAAGHHHFAVIPAGEHPQTSDPVDCETHGLGKSALRSWQETKVGQNHPKNFSCVRAAPSEAAPTINASHGILDGHGLATMHGTNHPYEPRRFTILEVKRICSFPDDFKMSGTFEQRWARLGNAVPPLMMKAVAEAIHTHILSRATP